MSIGSAWPQGLDFFGIPLVIEPSPSQLSGDTGLLPVRQFDERIGLTRAFADALDDDLASQPTPSRFENAVSIPSLKRLRDIFLDQFIASFDTPPRRLTFDLDAVDDPAHGRQQRTFWHGLSLTTHAGGDTRRRAPPPRGGMHAGSERPIALAQVQVDVVV
ncbi:MAG: transposase [Gemmataceae bacterium]